MFFLKKFFSKDRRDIDCDRLPLHIAIIMDGNGRWARRRGLPRNVGHREGSNAIKKIVKYCDKIGIKYLTIYAFSTENWKRPRNEVDTLMELLLEYLRNADRELAGNSVRIKVIGDMDGLPADIQKEIKRVTRSTADNKGMTLNIALNYGSRDEIISAIRGIAGDVVSGRLDIGSINEELLSNRLYTAAIPDPDMIIRTSGEKRISNFLLWQSAYSEFLFTDVLWPDFTEDRIKEAIKEYQNRNRRFGGV